MTMTTVDEALDDAPWKRACEAYRFYFGTDESVADDVVVAATGGPGLGWKFALNEALRQRGRQRKQIGWRSTCSMKVTEVPDIGGRGKGWVAHARVVTSRGEILDVWVRRQRRSQ